VRTLSFGTGVRTDFADLFGFSSRHFANLTRREHHTASGLWEITKEPDLLISTCACAPFLGAQQCSDMLRRNANLVQKRLDNVSLDRGNFGKYLTSEGQPMK
jgi:hypothetical protein